MTLATKQPDPDAPDVAHLFFETGDGRVRTSSSETS